MKRLGPKDLFDLRYLRDARFSPDGCSIAYAISRTDGEERFEIWICNADGSRVRRLDYAGNAVAPRWSPDGHSIAFVGDKRLHVASFPSLNHSEPLTPDNCSVQGAPAWSPDGANLVVSLLQQRVIQGPHRIIGNAYRADGLGFIDGLTQRIYRVNCNDRSLRCLTPNERMCSQPEWSPRGGRILYLAADDSGSYASFPARLLVLDIATEEVSQVLGPQWYIANTRWIPGGERIAVVGAPESTLTIPSFHLWVIDRCGNNLSLRTEGMIGNVGFFVQHDMPWTDFMYGNNALCAPDEETVLATVQIGGCAEIWRIALGGAIAMDRLVFGPRSCIAFDATSTAKCLLFAATDLQSPTELRWFSLEDHREIQLTWLNEDVLEDWPDLTVERFVFDSSDGTPIEAWFLAPAGPRGPIPTVLFIHGGPFGATGNAFRYDFHLLASQGFGVLFANFRGSTGYGDPFTRAIMGDWGGRAYPDHMGTVDAAIAKGFANPERLGVWGHSHGGFATCWIVGHTNRFKAAVAEAGFANFTTLYYLSDIPEIFSRDLGGRPHEIPDVYRACSPISYAHRSTTPTLLLHGEEDLRCPISEAEQFYRALQDAGCTTELFRIPDCSHSGDSVGPLSAREAQNQALLDWFQRFL